MNTPLNFFKFKPINMWLLDSIINSSIYAAKPEFLNDPFDCQIDFEFELKKAALNEINHENSILQAALNSPAFLENWRSVLSSCGVVSFTQDDISHKAIENILMWTHYADEHKGVCLEYSVGEEYINNNWIGDNAENPLLMCRSVNYKSELSISCLDNNFKNERELVIALLEYYLTTKTKPWCYEHERRIVFTKNGSVALPREALTAVRFGLKSPDEHVLLISRILSDYSPETRVFKAVKEKNNIKFIDV
ncbi:DUF2971 domain-containing protein [Aeromonas allosaccharophila]